MQHSLTGRASLVAGKIPKYVVTSASKRGKGAVARLSGGFRLTGDRGSGLKVNLMRLEAWKTKRAWIEGRVNGRKMKLFWVKGVKMDETTGAGDFPSIRYQLRGRIHLTGRLAHQIRRKVGLRSVRAGTLWGSLSPLTWRDPFEPEVDTSLPEPPNFSRPANAVGISGGTFVWRLRPSWVSYLGNGVTPFGGVTADPRVELPGFDRSLSIDFRFDLSGGWIQEEGGDLLSASLQANGGVYFRNCGSREESLGINYALSDPEIRVNNEGTALIFGVDGLDESPFNGARTVVVELGAPNPVREDGEWLWSAVPGTVASGAYGLFYNQYRADSEKGDNFGSATIRAELPAN